MANYPWYIQLQKEDDSLAQGDLIFDCPIIIPPVQMEEGDQIVGITADVFDVVVMTQSCDLENEKISLVQVCPFFNLDEHEFVVNSKNQKEKLGKKEKIRQGNLPGYHLLNSDANSGVTHFLIVDFRNTFAVHKSFLRSFIVNQVKRIRLLPPYREHLAQSFARYFMRVGLPVDIPSFR